MSEESVKKAEHRASLRMKLANTVAKIIQMEGEERRLRQALEAEPRQESLGEKRAASEPIWRPMRAKPKTKPDQEEPTLNTWEVDVNTDRGDESVDQMVDRLQRAGISDEQVEMEAEMRFNYYSQQKVAKLRAERAGRDEEEPGEEEPEPLLCQNGCGRPASEGYKACCRTCTDTEGRKHGPKCRKRHGPNDPNKQKEAVEEPKKQEEQEDKEEPAEPEGKDRIGWDFVNGH